MEYLVLNTQISLPNPYLGQHGVIREMWKNIKGEDVKQIHLADGFPNSPAKVEAVYLN